VPGTHAAAVLTCRALRRPQHRTGLVADVLCGRRPLAPAGHDRVLRLVGGQVRTGGGDLGDRDGHRGVIGPFAGLPPERPATDQADGQLGSAGRSELVRGAEGVAGGRGEQDTAGVYAHSSDEAMQTASAALASLFSSGS
jgi:hypothetical protein